MSQNFIGKSFTLAMATLFVGVISTSEASGYKLALQSRTDTSAPNEVYMASFDTYADLFSGNLGSGSDFTQLNISSAYQIAGLTYDGKYRMALQTRSDSSAPSEVYMASFDTYADLFSGNLGSGSDFTNLNISSAYEIAGLTYDGKYRLALQTRADSSAPNEVYMASFDTYADLLSGNLGSGSDFTQLNISSVYQIAGLTYDGKYRMALQTRSDTSAPMEVYMASFDTYADLFSGNLGSGSDFTNLNISSAYEIAGFAYEPSVVPEPASIFALAGASAMLVRRRKKQS